MNFPLPQVGAFPLDDARTRFAVWAPSQKRLELYFPGSDRAEPMIAGPDGYHTLTTHAPEGVEYQYRFADGRLRPDPASLAQAEGVHGPSRVMARRPLPPLAPAFANALARLTGKPQRALPFSV